MMRAFGSDGGKSHLTLLKPFHCSLTRRRNDLDKEGQRSGLGFSI